MMYTETCKDILVRFPEWLAEMLRRSAFLGLTAEHVEGDSCNLAGMFLHNSVDVPNFAAKFEPSEQDCSGLNPLIAAEKRHTHNKQVSKIGL